MSKAARPHFFSPNYGTIVGFFLTPLVLFAGAGLPARAVNERSSSECDGDGAERRPGAGGGWASRSPQKLSFRSVRKCWKCSLIDTIFVMGVRLLYRLGFSWSGQSHLTPSRFLTNGLYGTCKLSANAPFGKASGLRTIKSR